MTAGLPGTGIGGLFYLLLVLFMPLREVFRVLRGRGDVRRWRTIGGKLALAGGILTALWLEAWVLFEVFGLRQNSLAASAGASAEQAVRAARAASFATLASLGLVLFALAVLRLLVRRPLPGALRCAAVTRAPRAAGSENRLYVTYALIDVRVTSVRASRCPGVSWGALLRTRGRSRPVD